MISSRMRTASASNQEKEPEDIPAVQELSDEAAETDAVATEEAPGADDSPPTEEPLAAEESAAEVQTAEEAATELDLDDATLEQTSVNGGPDVSSGDEVHYTVSSSQLKLASPKFKNMLSGDVWTEATPDEMDGRYHIYAEDWDADALLILLNAIHLRNSSVPRTASLEMLAKVVVLAEYYCCLEAIELLVEIWIKKLKKCTPVPSDYCRDLMLWMCVTWVLRLPKEFSQTTAIAIKRSPHEELPTLDLPVTSFISRYASEHILNDRLICSTCQIDQMRIDTIGLVVSQLHDLLDEFRQRDYKCPSGVSSFECGSMLYGALTKEMEVSGLLSPFPTAPFAEMTFEELRTKIYEMRAPAWSSGHRRNYPHLCDLRSRVIEVVDKAGAEVFGLSLDAFDR
jgi:hypothetical protein